MTQKKTTEVALPIDQELAQYAREVAETERPPVSFIGLQAGILTYMGEAVKGNALDIIILAHGNENVWYEGAYDANNITPPSCFALGLPEEAGKDGGNLSPHPDVPAPVADVCGDCPNFAWGSAEGTSKGKACSTKRRIAVIPATALDSPDTLARAEMAILKLPVTSTKNWAKYVNECAAAYHRPPWALVTTISTSPHAKFQFTVNFDAGDLITDNDVLTTLRDMRTSAEQILLTPYDMSGSGKEAEPTEDSDKF